MTIIHDPGNTREINELYAVLSKDENGEGIFAHIFSGMSMPFVFGNKKLMDKVLTIARQASKETDKKLYLVKFTHKEVLEEIK